MRINWTFITAISRRAIVSLVILALLVSVAFTGQGIAVAQSVTQVAPGPAPVDKQLVSAPISQDRTGGKMAPDKKRGTTSTVLLATPVFLGSNDEQRVISEPSFDCDRVLPLDSRPVLGRLPHSRSMISSSLGRQGTLIGAKPDGTM